MKNIKNKLFGLLLITFAITNTNYSQDSLSFDLSYEVNRVYPSLSHTKAKLLEATTIVDLNKYYKPEWIRKFISVEIITSHNGEERHAVSHCDTLSQEQKRNINMSDVENDILVNINYIPENTLVNNDPKEFNFSFVIDPRRDAQFAAGQQMLNQYLEDNAMSKVSGDRFKIYNLTAVKFTINEEGQVIDVHMFESSKDEEVDAVMLEAICNMPNWIPGEYSNGARVRQDFVFTIGDHGSCVINLLNTRREG